MDTNHSLKNISDRYTTTQKHSATMILLRQTRMDCLDCLDLFKQQFEMGGLPKHEELVMYQLEIAME